MHLSNIKFTEENRENGENGNNNKFIFKYKIPIEIEGIISNNKLKNEVVTLAKNIFTTNIEKLNEQFDIDLDFLNLQINNINLYNDLGVNIDKIKNFISENIGIYIESINETLTDEKIIIKSEFYGLKKYGVEQLKDVSKKKKLDTLTDDNTIDITEDNIEDSEINNPKYILFKNSFLNLKFLNTNKIDTINVEKFNESLFNIINIYKKHIDDYLEYLKWENQYYFNSNNINLNSLNDLLFIFENNLEDFELIKEQVNIENIGKIIKLYNDKFEIHKIKSVGVEWFNKIYEFYESGDLDISNLDEYLVDFNTFNSFILYKSFIKKKINNLKYFRKNTEEYKREYELSEISFTNFLNLSQKELNDIDTERLINKLNNILGEENIELYLNDYYFLLKKIENIYSKNKYKNKNEKRSEREIKNNFLKNFFQKNSEDEIKLIISILDNIVIFSNNNIENLEENTNLIIKYKSLAEEKFKDDNFNPKSLNDISEYLNKENQQDFYKLELNNLGIDNYLIEEILNIYKDDKSLKLLFYILQKFKGNDLDDLGLLFSEKEVNFERLNIIVNTLSIIEKNNFNYNDILEIIEYIIIKENFIYNIELEKNNFLRENINKYKKGNGNSGIKILIIDFLKDEKSEDDLKNEIEKFEKIEIILNNKFDKSIFEIIKNKNEDKSEIFSSKINQFINNITQDFNSAQSHSQAVDFVKGNGKYTNIIRKKILQRLKKLNSETYLEHIERIKILNFNTFFVGSENLSWDTENIMKSSADINLPFFESLENFGENTIKNINLKGNNFTRLAEYYNEVFQKHKSLLEK